MTDLQAFTALFDPSVAKPRRAPRPDYHRSAEWLAWFDPACDCGICPSIPCPHRGMHGFNGAQYVGGSRNPAGGTISEDEWIRRSRIPRAYQQCQISGWIPQAAEQPTDVRRFISSWPPEKPFLALMGDMGTGKTHMAAGVLRYAWERHGKVGVFWPVRELLSYVKAQFDADTATTTEAEIQRVLDYSPLLVLDDWGKEQSTEWARSFLFSLVDRRYSNGWATVVTTNLSVGDDPATDRILDRDRTVTVLFQGESYRQRGMR